MDTDYVRILREYGFDAVPEREDTSLAFYHEIHNTVLCEGSPFNILRSSVIQAPDCLEQMIECRLVLQAEYTIAEGVSYVMTTWYESLAYNRVEFEVVQRVTKAGKAEIRVFTLTAQTGCSFLFVVSDA